MNIRILAVVAPLGLAACADSGVVWSDYDVQPSAIERNRAMMMQNPNDLVQAREASGRSGARAADVQSKYGRGEATSAAGQVPSGADVTSVRQGVK